MLIHVYRLIQNKRKQGKFYTLIPEHTPSQINFFLFFFFFYDDGRENPIATTVGFDCNSITFKVASATDR